MSDKCQYYWLHYKLSAILTEFLETSRLPVQCGNYGLRVRRRSDRESTGSVGPIGRDLRHLPLLHNLCAVHYKLHKQL